MDLIHTFGHVGRDIPAILFSSQKCASRVYRELGHATLSSAAVVTITLTFHHILLLFILIVSHQPAKAWVGAQPHVINVARMLPVPIIYAKSSMVYHVASRFFKNL